MLRRAVEEKGGTGSRAKLADFHTAGKTGTSQKAREGARGALGSHGGGCGCN